MMQKARPFYTCDNKNGLAYWDSFETRYEICFQVEFKRRKICRQNHSVETTSTKWQHRRQRWPTVSTSEFLSTIPAKVYPDPDHTFRNTWLDLNHCPLHRLRFKGQKVSTRISFSHLHPSPNPEWWTRPDSATTRPHIIKKKLFMKKKEIKSVIVSTV